MSKSKTLWLILGLLLLVSPSAWAWPGRQAAMPQPQGWVKSQRPAAQAIAEPQQTSAEGLSQSSTSQESEKLEAIAAEAEVALEELDQLDGEHQEVVAAAAALEGENKALRKESSRPHLMLGIGPTLGMGDLAIGAEAEVGIATGKWYSTIGVQKDFWQADDGFDFTDGYKASVKFGLFF